MENQFGAQWSFRDQTWDTIMYQLKAEKTHCIRVGCLHHLLKMEAILGARFLQVHLRWASPQMLTYYAKKLALFSCKFQSLNFTASTGPEALARAVARAAQVPLFQQNAAAIPHVDDDGDVIMEDAEGIDMNEIFGMAANGQEGDVSPIVRSI